MIQQHQIIKFSTFLRKLMDTYEVVEMKHAYRVNGIIDLYKDKRFVHCLAENERHTFRDIQKLYDYTMLMLKKHPFQDRKKLTKNNRLAYSEFEKTVLPKAKSALIL